MASSLSMVFDILAVDRASPAFRSAGESAGFADGAIGGMMKTLGAFAVGAAVVDAVKAASSFQASMLLIETQAGASRQEVEKMTPAILALAGPVAQAPEALANSLYHVESVGLRGAKALNTVRAAAELASVAHSNLEQTTNALTAAVASGIPGVQNMNQAMSTLNATVGSGDMKMSDLNEAMGSGILTVVKGYGLSIADVGAALATFGDNNIRGANAATMLRMAVQAMAVPMKGGDAILKALGVSTGQTDQALNKYGITAKRLAEDMQTGGLNKAITDLHDHLQAAGVQGNQVGEILTAAFGKRAGPGVAVLLGQFDRLQTKYADISAENGRFGSEWTSTTHNASFAFNSLKDSIDSIGIRIGSALLPPLAKAAAAIQGLLGGTVDWITKHGVLVSALAVSFGTVAAAIGVVTLATKAWAAATAIADAVMDANPIMVVVIALAALAAGLVYAYEHSKTFRDIVQGVLSDVSGAFEAAWNDVLKPVLDGLTTAWTDTWNAVKAVWDAVKPVIATIAEVVYAVLAAPFLLICLGLQAAWVTLWDAAKGVWDTVGHPIFDAVVAVAKFVWSALKPVFQLYVDGWRLVWDGVKLVWDTVGAPVFDVVKSVVTDAWTTLKTVFGWISDGWSALWGGMSSAFGAIWGGIQKAIQDGVNTVIDVINAFVSGFNWILGKLPGGFHIDSIQHVSIGAAPAAAGAVNGMRRTGFADGGMLPGFSPGQDNMHFFSPEWGALHLAGGEFIVNSQASRRFRPLLERINGAGGGGRSFSGGGWLDPLGLVSDAKSIGGDVLSGISWAGGKIEDGLRAGVQGAIDAALSAVEGPVKKVIGAIPTDMLRDVVMGVFDKVDGFLRGIVNGQGSQARTMAAQTAAAGSVGGGAAQWAPLVAQAAAMLGIPATVVPGVLNLISHESGGNPNAINLWDSNAQAGHPSQGLMQEIPGTFEAYRSMALPDNILNPLSNIYSGVNYALQNYGLGMLMAGGRHDAAGNYIGYRYGTNFVPADGFAMLHRGEAVVPAAANQGGPWTASGDEIIAELRALREANADLVEAFRSMPHAVALLRRTGAL